MKRIIRTNKFIKPRFQLRLAVTFGLVAIAAILVQVVVLNMTAQSIVQRLPHDAQILMDAWPRIILTDILISAAVILPLALLIGALAVFPTAGRIHALEEYLKAVLAGDNPRKVQPRRGDPFLGLGELINEVAVQLQDSLVSTSVPGCMDSPVQQVAVDEAGLDAVGAALPTLRNDEAQQCLERDRQLPE